MPVKLSSRDSPSAAIPFPTLPKARKGTGLALTPWRSRTNENNLNLRLFYQTDSGEIRERFWDSGSGWSTYSSVIGDPPVIAKPNSPLAQATWLTLGGAREIQLFYLNFNNIICDAVYAGDKWTKGCLEHKGYVAGEYSKLGSTVGRRDREVLVYFQDSNDYVQELVYTTKNREWIRSGADKLNLKTARGAGLGAVCYVWKDSDYLRLWTQTTDHGVVRKVFEGLDVLDVLYKSTATPLGTSIALAMVNTEGENQGLDIIILYFVGERGIVRKLLYTQGIGWDRDPGNIVEGDNNGGSIVAVNWQRHSARMIFTGKNGLNELVQCGEHIWDLSDFSL